MRLARALVLVSIAAFLVTGFAYLLIPGATLAIVGIASSATNDFLIRTEGVALLTGAGLLLAIRDGNPSQMRVGLLVLAFYFVVGSWLTSPPIRRERWGMTSVPSAAIGIGLGLVCLVAVVRLGRPDPPGSGEQGDLAEEALDRLGVVGEGPALRDLAKAHVVDLGRPEGQRLVAPTGRGPRPRLDRVIVVVCVTSCILHSPTIP